MQIQGKCAIVTGGASGLGEATVRRLHSGGASVVVADVNREAGETVARELGRKAIFQHTDVTDEKSMGRAVGRAVEVYGNVHIVVSCAGIAIAEKVLGKDAPHDLTRFSRVIEVNLLGTFNALRLSAAAMAQNSADEADGERGVIINTASVAAFEGQIGQAAYSASKGGVVGLTLPAARELARHGIRVVSIAPGVFETPLMAALPKKAKLSLREQVLFPRRLGQPTEYAALVQCIIENVFLNGTTIRLDGALRMPPR